MIWWMSMLMELRSVANWWIVVLFMPREPQDDKVLVELVDNELEIHALPTFMRFHAILLHLIPRTVICARLCLAGPDFLLSADSYGDLILHSVALGFLVEVDEMLFSATVSPRYQGVVGACRPLEVPLPTMILT